MTPKQAENYAARLVEADIMNTAQKGKAEGKSGGGGMILALGVKYTHGSAAIDGEWANGHVALVICDHVAEALLAAGRWTADAIRGCEHPVGLKWKAPTTKRAAKRPTNCTPDACLCTCSRAVAA